MIGIVYLGNNSDTQERLKYIPGRLVQFTTNYKDCTSACAPHVRNEHFIVFYEQSVQTEDITAITYIKKKCKKIKKIILKIKKLKILMMMKKKKKWIYIKIMII